jgi:phage gpG-like protein
MPIRIQVIGGDALEKMGKLISGEKDRLMDRLFDAAQKFGYDAVAISSKRYLSGPRPEKLDRVHGRLQSSIASETKRTGPVIETKVGTNVEYAAIHEFGGVVRPTVTDKMRKMAWAMFFKTKDDKWKGLALTSKNKLRIRIPSRPFLRPAVRDAMPSFEENIRRALAKISFEGA